MTKKEERIEEAKRVLQSLEMPKGQQNKRSALVLLALLNLTHEKAWKDAESPRMGISPIIGWVRDNYDAEYAPNTRETIRRQTVHQFVDSGLVVHNPDEPSRSVKSPDTVYQIEPTALDLLRTFGTADWDGNLSRYTEERGALAARYAAEREQKLIPVVVGNGQSLSLSPGAHSELIRDIIESFGGRFAPGGTLVYVGDTGAKWAHLDEDLLASIGVQVDPHGKMPDVVFYDADRKWLILAEAVTSHGPVDPKRHGELVRLFSGAEDVGLVFVTAFPDRATMSCYVDQIAWETEVWVADSPSHLIHFDGERFLGPYQDEHSD